MTTSSLDLENLPRRDRQVHKGHGTDALGPSDSSDSGSDIRGGIGLNGQVDIGLDRGTTSDPDEGAPCDAAGPDIGDAELDSDSDASGTGERKTAGRDSSIRDGQDIGTDRIKRLDELYADPDAGTDTDNTDSDR